MRNKLYKGLENRLHWNHVEWNEANDRGATNYTCV